MTFGLKIKPFFWLTLSALIFIGVAGAALTDAGFAPSYGFAAGLAAVVLGASVPAARWRRAIQTANRKLAGQVAVMARANARLQEEITENRQFEAALRRHKAHLEIQLKAGTCELQRDEADQRETADVLK